MERISQNNWTNFFYEPLKICTYESLTQTINFLKNNLKVNWPLCEASALFLTVNWLSQDQLWSSWDDTAFHPMLTHFRPTFSPCRNQVVGFLLAKCLKNIFHRCFSNILLVKTNNLVYPYGLITPFLIHWIWNFPLKFPSLGQSWVLKSKFTSAVRKNNFLVCGIICYLSSRIFIIARFYFIPHLEHEIRRWNLKYTTKEKKLEWFRGSSTSKRLKFEVEKVKVREKE